VTIKQEKDKEGSYKKQIIFTETDKRDVELRLRLQYVGATRTHFFRSCITGFLEEDKDFLKFWEKVQGKDFSEEDKKALEEVKKKRRELKNSFVLSDDEISGIFDIVEEQFPGLKDDM
jgi:hypothetical protein